MERFKNRFRHEYKYLVDDRDIVLLENNLRHVLPWDANSGDRAYQIRSVYFDDYRDSALSQNLAGISPRSKYRIRIYDRSPEPIYLERKIKDYDMVYKESCRINKQECDEALRSRNIGTQLQERSRELFLQFQAARSMVRLKPAVIVEYERRAYVCEAGNVRITFDRNLASSVQFDRFFEERMHKRPVMPAGKHLLEVKYDEFLPGYVRKSLDLGKLERTTYSKYMLCRNYVLH